MKTISNKQLTIQVSPHGAELCSIVANGKEYLWQADPAFWKRLGLNHRVRDGNGCVP